MKKTLFLAIVTIIGITSAFSQDQKKYYSEDIDAMEQINQALEQARESNRYVLCQVGGNWCPWCIRFANFAYSDSVVAPLIEKNYVYIHVNYSKENKNIEAMKYLGNPGRFGYPVFVIIDFDGRPIHIQESESLEEGKSYNQKRVARFLRLWTPEAVNAPVK